MLEAEQDFQQMKSHADTIIKEVIISDKKLKQAIEWLASMRKRMTEARKELKSPRKRRWRS